MVTSPQGPTARPDDAPPILVDTGWLVTARARDAAGTVVVCDVRWYLDGRDAAAAYRAGHVPGARFVDLETVCSAKGAATEGRHPLPTPEAFAASVAALGIGDGDVVVAYDDTGGGTAGRFVWMLRALGAPAALLDGGLTAWLAARPDDVESGDAPSPPAASFTARPWPTDRLADWADAERAAGDGVGAPLLIDARGADRYRGDSEPVDPRAGHVPGAVNLPWAVLVDPDTRRFRPRDELVGVFAAAGVTDDRDVVLSCGSGVSACALFVALEHVGRRGARLFVPSWSGWSSDPDRRAAVGDAP